MTAWALLSLVAGGGFWRLVVRHDRDATTLVPSGWQLTAEAALLAVAVGAAFGYLATLLGLGS